MKDLNNPDSELVAITDTFDADTYVLDNKGSKLYLVTDLDAPNKRVVTVDASAPAAANWQDFIAETDNVLSVGTGAGYIFAEYMVDAIAKVEQYDYEGNKVRDVELPGVGSVSGFGGKDDAEELYYTFSTYNTRARSISMRQRVVSRKFMKSRKPTSIAMHMSRSKFSTLRKMVPKYR